MRNKITVFLMVAAVAVLSLDACGGGANSASTRLTKLNVQFGFPLDGGTAPECLALLRGYYRAAGLDVKLLPGGPIGTTFLDATNAVATNDNVQIAVDNVITTLIIGKAKNPATYRVKAFADLWQEAPIGFLVRASSALHSIKDLGGRQPNGSKWVIGATPDVPLLISVANYLGEKPSSLDVKTTGADPTTLIAGQVNAFFGFDTNQGVSLQQAGIPYRFLPLSEIPGLAQPAYVAMARQTTLKSEHGALAKWLKATQHGFTDMVKSPQAAAEAVRSPRCGGPEQNVAHNTALIQRSLRYIQPHGQFGHVGSIDEQVISNYSRTLAKSLGLSRIPAGGDLVDLSVLQAIGQQGP